MTKWVIYWYHRLYDGHMLVCDCRVCALCCDQTSKLKRPSAVLVKLSVNYHEGWQNLRISIEYSKLCCITTADIPARRTLTHFAIGPHALQSRRPIVRFSDCLRLLIGPYDIPLRQMAECHSFTSTCFLLTSVLRSWFLRTMRSYLGSPNEGHISLFPAF